VQQRPMSIVSQTESREACSSQTSRYAALAVFTAGSFASSGAFSARTNQNGANKTVRPHSRGVGAHTAASGHGHPAKQCSAKGRRQAVGRGTRPRDNADQPRFGQPHAARVATACANPLKQAFSQ